MYGESPDLSRKMNGTEDGGMFSVWDGDDMTLEMVTDINDGNVDEEVSRCVGALFSPFFFFAPLAVLSLWSQELSFGRRELVKGLCICFING